MDIREATAQDLPEIIRVLKLSLGEADLPLSEAIWKYKHIDNPFGRSLVLIAVDHGKIVGVRAFMKWKWRKGNSNFLAFRAVDTATHPDFQGKGIFKKLTLEAVKTGKELSYNFVFNTPNVQSRPGYLKMGWKQVGKIRVALQPSYNSFWKLKEKQLDYQITNKATPIETSSLCNSWNAKLKLKEKLFTPKSAEFLSWRYEDNPLQQYEVLSTPDLYLAAYIKKRKNIKELRISECIFKNDSNSIKEVRQIINEWSSKFGAQLVTWSPKVLKLNSLSYQGAVGPILTVRGLDLNERELDVLLVDDSWNYSIGDLELF